MIQGFRPVPIGQSSVWCIHWWNTRGYSGNSRRKSTANSDNDYVPVAVIMINISWFYPAVNHSCSSVKRATRLWKALYQKSKGSQNCRMFLELWGSVFVLEIMIVQFKLILFNKSGLWKIRDLTTRNQYFFLWMIRKKKWRRKDF